MMSGATSPGWPAVAIMMELGFRMGRSSMSTGGIVSGGLPARQERKAPGKYLGLLKAFPASFWTFRRFDASTFRRFDVLTFWRFGVSTS
jgi:hypothetical protein